MNGKGKLDNTNLTSSQSKQLQKALFQYQCKKPNVTSQLQANLFVHNDVYLWAYEIIKFFEIEETFMREQASVRKIESFFANCKKILLKVKFQKMIYHLRNMCGNVLDLPDHVLVKILEYLTFQERFQNHQLSTKMRFCLKQPYLFKSLDNT